MASNTLRLFLKRVNDRNTTGRKKTPVKTTKKQLEQDRAAFRLADKTGEISKKRREPGNVKRRSPKDMFPDIWGDRRPLTINNPGNVKRTVSDHKAKVKKFMEQFRKKKSNGRRPKHEPRMTK